MLHASQFGTEITFAFSRSSGPGGQNVNKVNSKVTLRFDVSRSQVLTPEEKETLQTRLGSVLTRDGILVLSSQDKRSQLSNKESVLLKFERLINKALAKKKLRKASKPTRATHDKRIQHKKRHAEKKKWRQKL